MPSTFPSGSWPSPLTADAVATSSPRTDGARFVGDEIWWGETVPSEGGRTTVRRRRADGTVEDLLPAPLSARSKVHEYGGGAWTAADGELVYAEKADQRVWAVAVGGHRRPLTPDDATARFAGLTWAAGMLLAIRERHNGSSTPVRDIVRIPLDGSAGRQAEDVVSVVSGSHFIAQPALSPDGSRIAWVAWNHPDMPWDQTALHVADIRGTAISESRIVNSAGTAALQPVWTGKNELTYLDDPTGRWNLWRIDGDGPPIALAPADADTGGALWVLGTRWFGALDDGRLVAIRTEGADEVVVIDRGRATPVPVPVVAGAAVEDTSGARVLVSGATAAGGSGLWLVDLALPDAPRVERIAGGIGEVGPEWFPSARTVRATGPHGPVHAFAYPPTNPEARAPSDEKPPYLVLVHGGPTSHVGPAASAKVAYFTSRGIGVLDVNYGGSTGYGRGYRERLRGQWGVVDVDDVAAAAAALIDEGLADPHRIAIEGGSAGGWTVLSALVRTDVFAAGISRYGVGDARALAADTHDFEARYLDGLIGPLPEAEQLYIDRSPLTSAHRFRVPMLILQGSEDPVVPPAQAEALRDALVERSVPHAYVLYDGEGHGFRRAETIVHALESELAFLGAAFGFDTPGVEPLTLS